MIKLVILSALVASTIAAFAPFRQFSSRPPVYPSPTPVYRPLPVPVQSGRQIAILRLDSDIAPDGSSYQYAYRALPTPQVGRVIAILRLDKNIEPNGSYQYAYETENGISAQESGALTGSGPDAGISASGSFQYTSPEGVPVQISYVAGPDGFQPSGNVLPTPPPTPEAILRSLAYNAAHPEPASAVYRTSAPVPVYRPATRYYKR